MKFIIEIILLQLEQVFRLLEATGDGFEKVAQCLQSYGEICQRLVKLHFDLEARVRKIEATLSPDQPCK